MTDEHTTDMTDNTAPADVPEGTESFAELLEKAAGRPSVFLPANG